MKKYIKSSQQDYTEKYWEQDYKTVDSIYPVEASVMDGLSKYNYSIQRRLVETVRKMLGILNQDISIQEYILKYEDDSRPVQETLSEYIRDEFDYKEANCGGSLTEYLNNLHRLMYGTDFEWM